MSASRVRPPLTIRMHERDNVAIVANDGGLAAGTTLPSGLVLLERVPQGHKVALVDIAADAPVLRYGISIGQALRPIPAGSWVHERLLKIPDAPGLEGLPIATAQASVLAPLHGYSFEGYRNADGSVVPAASPPSLATMATLSRSCTRIVSGGRTRLADMSFSKRAGHRAGPMSMPDSSARDRLQVGRSMGMARKIMDVGQHRAGDHRITPRLERAAAVALIQVLSRRLGLRVRQAKLCATADCPHA